MKDNMNFELSLKECAQKCNRYLAEYYGNCDEMLKLISDAQQYSLLSGGKRIRAYLTFELCKMYGETEDKAAPFACAIEMVHAYSLIHDDLPCMDNDDYRRGKLTNHKVYGEAVAVLAGDALLTKAFEIISLNDEVTPDVAINAVRILSKAAGDNGMIGGQILDLSAEKSCERSLEMLNTIHRLKTGAMIKAAAQLGCLVAGVLPESEIMRDVEMYADKIGLAFQIVDDILDVVGDSSVLGKNVGSDKDNNKLTFMSFYSVEEAEALAEKLTKEAVGVISKYKNSEKLVALAEYLLKRKY